MALAVDSLPTDLAAAHAMIIAKHEALLAAEARASAAESEAKHRALLIEKLKYTIAKLRHEKFGQSSERGAVLEQLELALAELEEDAAQAEATAEIAAAEAKVAVRSFERRRPARRPLPEHLPRERIVYPVPAACPCCGGVLHKIGEDVTETLEVVPRQWKVIQHVREKFSCRSCESVAQPPAPSHPIARGRAGPGLLAQVLFSKYCLHLPLNRQSTAYAWEGVELEVSTLADWVGACAATLMPMVEAIRAHVFAAERIHADDTTVPVQAKGKCRTGRLWTYVRDDRPFGGPAAPAAALFYSPDRGGEHPERHLASYAGLMQADAYAGFNRLYEAARKPGPIVEAACWAHARRKFFDLARLRQAPIAIEAVKRIDALFAIEREINGLPPAERVAVRQERSRPLIAELEAWLREQRRKLSSKSDTAKAIDYSLKRWAALTRFLDDGRLCMSNNAAERTLRCVAVGRHNWTFAGSDEGGHRAAAMYTLIETAKLNDIDPQAWLADVLARLPDYPARRISDLLPWNWRPPPRVAEAA
jgi:transposase